ncbi:MAG: hypothetical protein HY718_11620, partial [Planctomycetes bacterium]|nr:hypothetical protein [Planctomycetota bacterium]
MANVNRSPPPAAVAAGKSFAVTARESLESIVVAFALAFIFRAFIVEAFVIPTGSMAPTLYGQQITHTCSTCGFEYARGVEQSLPGSRPPDATLTCPNCGSTADQVAGLELLRPSSGDRILVHKWPFSVGGEFGPERWGVTVFKDPHNGTINYIKRLVGKPGEILEIIQGDVYTASLDVLRKHDPAVIAEMDEIRRELYRFAHGGPTLRQEDVDARYAAINKRIMPYLTIQRKALDAPDAQKSLWFNIYQQDFLPNYRTQESPESRVGWSAALLPKVDTLEPEQLNRGRIPAELGSALARVKIELPESPGLIVEEPNRKWRVSAATGGDLLIVREESRLAVYDAAAAEA